MEIRTFKVNRELDILNGWLKARGMGPARAGEIPRKAFIAYEGDVPVATCFLRRCEGCYGFIDGLATNPEAPGPLRHEAQDLLIEYAVAQAREEGMTHLVAYCTDKTALVRSRRHGFVTSPFALIVRDLLSDRSLI